MVCAERLSRAFEFVLPPDTDVAGINPPLLQIVSQHNLKEVAMCRQACKYRYGAGMPNNLMYLSMMIRIYSNISVSAVVVA